MTPGDGTGAAEEAATVGAVPVSLIRQALEAAWLVGRAGPTATPPFEPPRRLRPLLRFAKLPAKSLATVREVLDGDEEFRARVAATVDPELVEPASWLWLTRPHGWERGLAAISEQAEAAAHESHEDRAERRARRRLEAAEAARARSEEAADNARRLAAERLDGLTRERQARRAAEADVAALREEIEGARRAAAISSEEMAAALRRAEGAESTVAGLLNQLAAAESERDRLVGEAAALEGTLAASGQAQYVATTEAAGREGRIASAVDDAALAAQALGAALARAGREIAGSRPDGPPGSGSGSAGSVGAPAGAPVGAGDGAVGTGRRVEPRWPGATTAGRRRPIPVPGGLLGDSVEAAAHLVRRPNVLLLVDGYNVSLNAWPGLGLADQRQRLTAALGELAARANVSVHVVFDASADEQLPPPTGTSRRPVRVSFSERGQDADEVLIELVEGCDPNRPVVVATDDRRVRAEVDRLGANIISVAQLLGVIGRRPQER